MSAELISRRVIGPMDAESDLRGIHMTFTPIQSGVTPSIRIGNRTNGEEIVATIGDGIKLPTKDNGGKVKLSWSKVKNPDLPQDGNPPFSVVRLNIKSNNELMPAGTSIKLMLANVYRQED